jgi:hypothetical protein
MKKFYDVQLKYSGQIISVHMTSEQRSTYDNLDAVVTAARTEFLFTHFTPLPSEYCTALAVNGDWNVGNWLEVAMPISTLKESSYDKMVVRNIYEVTYKEALSTELWTGLRLLSIDKMRESLELPRVICEDIYDLHELGIDDGLSVIYDGEYFTIKR